jgi:CDP-diacylglycerol--serine O-phosphatidyltransferase
MDRKRSNAFLSFGIPQLFTAARIILAGWALSASIANQLQLAASLITFGAVTDGLDGIAARKLRSVTEFGALFDYFADYLCYIVAPWILSTKLLPDVSSPLAGLALGLPLLTGAVRYARNGRLVRTEDFEQVGFPGLGTVFYACLIVGWTFLGLAGNQMNTVLCLVVTALCVLMVTPVRYPKLVTSKLVFFPVLLGLLLMPLVLTKYLAALTLVLVGAYVVLGPVVLRAGARAEVRQ